MAEVTWRNYKDNKNSRPAPLKGIKVLEIATLLLGPGGPGFLAKLGAEVIKCEMPPLGDTVRNLVPFGHYFREHGCGLTHPNLGKYWIGLDLHKPEGQKVFRELAAKADIIEENMRPGVLEKWNVGYRQIKEINPGIIYISKNGYGQWGQYADENRPSNDGGSQAASGFAWMSSFPGKPPLKSRLYVADAYGGLMGEIPVLAALHYREKTGKGQFIELSQTESLMRTMSWVWPYQGITGESAMPTGNRDQCVCPADTFRCVDDSFVAVAAPAPEEFKGLCNAMGRPELAEDSRFMDHLVRLKEENAVEILKVISDWVKTLTLDQVISLAEKHGFAASEIRSAKDITEDPHFRERDYITEIDDPLDGPMLNYDFPVMMSKTPPRINWSVRPVGFDNEYVMTQVLSKNKEQIKQLYECGALGKWADIKGRRPASTWDGKSGLILSREPGYTDGGRGE